MSSFQIGGTTVTFIVDMDQFAERVDGPLRTWDLRLFLSAAADYASLLSLRSWQVSVRPIPGASVAYVDIGGGAGAGTLTIDNVADSPFTAALTKMDRQSAFPGGGRICRATFQQTA